MTELRGEGLAACSGTRLSSLEKRSEAAASQDAAPWGLVTHPHTDPPGLS